VWTSYVVKKAQVRQKNRKSLIINGNESMMADVYLNTAELLA
jgi:hypothetical protein